MAKEKLDRNDPARAIWECPACYGINAWDWNEADKASSLLKVEVKCAHGSGFDNICGHCGADIVRKDSPIMAECYTHISSEELEDQDDW